MWPNRPPHGAPPLHGLPPPPHMMGGSRPDFSQPPPGYHAGMPPPTFRPSGSNMGPLPPRMPLPPTPMNGGGDRGWGTPPGGARGGPGIGAGGPSSSNGGGGGGGGGVPQGGQTTLFIGGISPGISDEILEQLLNACGQLRSLKRVRGATGKPQPFGFAEFEDPDAVLRALVVLNGIELPNLEARSEPGKKLIVKADEKTRTFLDEYEKLMLRTEADDELEASSVRSITHILSSLTSSTPLPPTSSTALTSVAPEASAAVAAAAPGGGFGSGGPPPATKDGRQGVTNDTPHHLRDLAAEDLPEDKRDGVLSQIGMFRGSQVERERVRRKQDEERERQRIEAIVREEARARELRAQAAAAANASGGGVRDGDQPPNPYASRSGVHDPQSYNQPVAFVPAGGAQANGRWPNGSAGGSAALERTDEEEEAARKERRRRTQLETKRERERRLEQRERQRFQHLDREANVDRVRLADEQRAADGAREREERWDSDDDETRDVWVVDRTRWRSQRQLVRRREEEADTADALAEQAELEQAAREAEALLARRAAEQAELAQKQKAAGILTDEVAPVKLSIGGAGGHHGPAGSTSSAAAAAAGGSGGAGGASGSKASGAFGEDEDDELAASRRRRVLVKLDPLEGLSGAEREQKRKRILDGVRSKLPAGDDEKAIFAAEIPWAALTDDIITTRLRPAARAGLERLLGELEDEDLLDFALDHVRERKAGPALVEGLEPVLEDDAGTFARAFYRTVLFEALAADEGVGTEGVSL